MSSHADLGEVLGEDQEMEIDQISSGLTLYIFHKGQLFVSFLFPRLSWVFFVFAVSACCGGFLRERYSRFRDITDPRACGRG